MKNYLRKFVKDDAAFTLIELLVVIAIIGTLSTIAFVSLQSAQDSADDSKDIAQLRSLELALIQYKSTNGHYPDVTGANACDTFTANTIGIAAALTNALPTFDWTNDDYFYCSNKTSKGDVYVLGVKNIDDGNKVLETDIDGDSTTKTNVPNSLVKVNTTTDMTNGWAVKGGSTNGPDCGTVGTGDNVYCLMGGQI